MTVTTVLDVPHVPPGFESSGTRSLKQCASCSPTSA